MEENQEKNDFDRSLRKESYSEGGGNKVMSNNVRYCRSSKLMEPTCFGEEKARFNNWFSASSQGKTSDIKGQIVDEKRGHS